MNDAASSESSLRRPASTKGKLRGPKPPLRVGHVWSIRAKLQLERRVRDLALFNLAIDSKLRGCDLVALRVDDVAPNGYAIDRANVRQSKTGRPVRFELTEVTRQALDDYLRISGRKLGQCLFMGRGGPDQHLTTRQCSPRWRVGQRYRPRSPQVRNPFHAPDQGDIDLPAHWKSPSCAAAPRPYED
jgi:integrase